MTRGKHEKRGRHEKVPHVHDWKSYGYDPAVKKTLWKCACLEQEWTEPGKHPDRP